MTFQLFRDLVLLSSVFSVKDLRKLQNRLLWGVFRKAPKTLSSFLFRCNQVLKKLSIIIVIAR